MISKKIENDVLNELIFYIKQEIRSCNTTKSYLKAGSKSYQNMEYWEQNYKHAIGIISDYQNQRIMFRNDYGIK